jgi:hypothetical protein
MINLENVTLVSVASVRVDRTIKALKFSSKNIKHQSPRASFSTSLHI